MLSRLAELLKQPSPLNSGRGIDLDFPLLAGGLALLGLGLVMPGEKKIDVLGLDDDSDSSSSKKSSNAKKASEVAKEIEEVGKDVPWYIQALDMLFGFNGVEGQAVVSDGK